MKPVWHGSISFGLVSIPVSLFSAIKPRPLSFTVLHKKCKTPLEYERWCPKCNTEVDWNNVVKGIKLPGSSTYTVLTTEEIEELRPEATETIEIMSFTDYDAIAPIYFDNHYYLQPKEQGIKAYTLLTKALEQENCVAIGTFVLRNKSHIIAIQPYDNGLLLSTLHYEQELRPHPHKTIEKKPRISREERDLAKDIIQKLYRSTIDLSKFKDTYIEKVKKVLLAKKAGKKIVHKKTKRKITIPENLTSALKASLKMTRTEHDATLRAKKR